MTDQRDSPVRQPLIIAAATDALSEMQAFREALELTDEPLDVQVRRILTAAVAFYRVALPIGALLLTDHALGDEFHDVARSSGMGPQVPVEETLNWVRQAQTAGLVHPDHAPRPLAMLLCASSQYLASFRVILPEDLPEEVLGTPEMMMSPLLTVLTTPPAGRAG